MAVRCTWHDQIIDKDAAVLVGALERGSGPAYAVWACDGCVTTHELMPLAEHPDSSDGRPRYSDGRFVLGAPPLAAAGDPQ
jgi:hypothetical protein